MKPTLLHTLFPALLLSLLLGVGCKKDKEADAEEGDGDGKQSIASGEGNGEPSGGGGPGGGRGPGGPGGMGPGGEGGEGGEFGPGGGEFGGGPGGGFGGPGGGQQRPQPVRLDPNKPQAPQMIWTVNTGRRLSPGLDIRVLYLGKPASTIQKAFGNPTDAKLVGTNGEWTYPGMKIRDAQGQTYNAVKFTIQPVPNGGGKVIAVDVIPGAITGGGGQNANGGIPGGSGPGGFPGGPGQQRGGPGAP